MEQPAAFISMSSGTQFHFQELVTLKKSCKNAKRLVSSQKGNPRDFSSSSICRAPKSPSIALRFYPVAGTGMLFWGKDDQELNTGAISDDAYRLTFK